VDGYKQVIEVFGIGMGRWHTEEQADEWKLHYKSHGWACLVVFDWELWLEPKSLIGKIREFSRDKVESLT